MPCREHNSGGMWGGLPEEWAQQDIGGRSTETEEKEIPKKRLARPVSDPAEEKAVEQESPEQKKTEKKAHKGYFQEKREQKKKLREFEKNSEKNRLQGVAHVRKAYLTERKGNRRDYIALAVASGFVILGIVIFVFLFTGTGQQRVYDLIEGEHYATAYQAIAESHESGKNVDSLVYAFIDSCVEHNESKRAVAALEFLSEEASSETDFFDRLVEALRAKGKEKRAEEVLRFMTSRGGVLAQEAEKLSAEAGIG